MWLDQNTFKTVIASTPLFSIDLVVRNSHGKILLGRRLNRPAQGYWFVPGGRVLKNETLDCAFKRLTQHELGQSFARGQGRLLDIYEHIYTDSIFGDAPDTHYVIAGYLLDVPQEVVLEPPVEQHAEYRWWSPAEMMNADSVHENTRLYLSALERV